MSEVSAFYTRFDYAKPGHEGGHPTVDEVPVSDDELAQASREMTPFYLRLAERADVDFGELVAEHESRMQIVPRVVVARAFAAGTQDALLEEIQNALINTALENFLAGAVWEQERHLPSLEG